MKVSVHPHRTPCPGRRHTQLLPRRKNRGVIDTTRDRPEVFAKQARLPRLVVALQALLLTAQTTDPNVPYR